MAAALSIRLEVDGHRADIALIKTAVALAAYHERRQVLPQDIAAAAVLALPHRMRRKPFETGTLEREIIDQLIESLSLEIGISG